MMENKVGFMGLGKLKPKNVSSVTLGDALQNTVAYRIKCPRCLVMPFLVEGACGGYTISMRLSRISDVIVI